MKQFLAILITLLSASSFAQSPITKRLEIPKTDSVEKLIEHTGYAFRYSEQHEQAIWVAYELTAAETIKTVDRDNNFQPDPKVSTGTATKEDYKGSGYDRGHLAPAADMLWSKTAMQESFYFSNMSPQAPEFNQHIWKNLEALVRNWAEINGNLYIVTGPVLKNGLKTIGANKVSVPEYYYKVILDHTKPEIKAIGFIMPNKGSKDSLQRFAVSIDSVEAFTGLDFFPQLEDKEEKQVEKTVCISCWNWQIIQPSNDILDGQAAPVKVETEKKESVSVQCSGTTQAGKRCRNMTTNSGGRCHLHER